MSDFLTDEDLDARARFSFIAMLRMFAGGNPGSSVIELPGAVRGCCVPAAAHRPLLNAACFGDGSALVEQLPELARRYAQAGVEAWTLWIYPGQASPELTAAFESAGMRRGPSQTSMAAAIDEVRLESPPPPDGFSVAADGQWAELARANELAYGFADGEYDHVMDQAEPDEYNHLVVARGPDGAVASCGFFLEDGDNVAIGWIATVPAARRLGLASQVIREGLNVARAAGCVTASLEATADGEPVYQGIGFRSLGTIETWQHGG